MQSHSVYSNAHTAVVFCRRGILTSMWSQIRCVLHTSCYELKTVCAVKKISVYPRIFCGAFSIILTEHCNVARATLFLRFTDTNVYGTGSVKIRKTRHRISVDIWMCLQCVSEQKFDMAQCRLTKSVLKAPLNTN